MSIQCCIKGGCLTCKGTPEGAARARAYRRQYRKPLTDEQKLRAREYYAANKASLLAKKRQYYADNPEIMRARSREYWRLHSESAKQQKKLWRQNNIERLKESKHQYYLANSETIKATERQRYRLKIDHYKSYQRQYRLANPGKIRAHLRLRKKHVRRATPPWLTTLHKRQLSDIYGACPPGHHVDHIIPLKHPLVCGLHVPWNLQVLTQEENLKKSNRFIP